MKSKLIKLLSVSLLTALLLSACGECKRVLTPTSQPLNLSISAPSQYPAGVAVTVPALVTNIGTASYTNLGYTITNNTTKANLTITPQSLVNCRALAPTQSCTLQVQVPANSVAGAFAIEASQLSANEPDAKSSMLNNLLNKVSASSSAMVNVTIGLTELPNNSGIGINGVNFYYPTSVYIPNNSSGVVIITMVITSADAGAFNTFDVVDSNGNSLSYQVLSANSGAGMSDLAQGSIVSLAVNIPSAATQLSFKPVLEQVASNSTTGQANAIDSGIGSLATIVVNRPTSTPQALLSMFPSNFTLNESSPSQIITIVNNGNATATNLAPQVSAPMSINTSASTCGATLVPAASCTYVVDMDTNTLISGTSTVVVDSNDAQTLTSMTSTFNYHGRTSIGLTISSPSNPNFDFSTTTNNPAESSLVTLTNTGLEDITLNTFTPPTYFTVSTLGAPNPCQANQVLSANQSCNIVLTYNNNMVTSTTNTNVALVSYTYLDIDGVTPLTGSSEVGLSYSTVQSQAVLSVGNGSSPQGTFNFGNLLNNNAESSIQVITISNTGDTPVVGNITPSFTQPNGANNLYSIVANNCPANLGAGASCTITVRSGPTYAGAQTANGTLNLSYVPYTNASANNPTTALTTQITGAKSAVIVTSIASMDGFVAGNGTSTTPYKAGQPGEGDSEAPKITYTVTNTGDVPATNFYESYNNATLAPWSITNTTCGTSSSKVTLAENGGNCTITYTLSTSTVGGSNLALSTLSFDWVDQDSPNGQSQLVATTDVYADVFAAAQISFSAESATVAPGGSTTITATLTGGYNVTGQTVSINSTDSTGGSIVVTSNPSPCTLSSESASCVFTINALSNAPITTYNLSVANSGNIMLPFISLPVSIAIQWTYLGSSNIASAAATTVAFAFNPTTNQPYIAYSDVSNGSKLSVMKYDGFNWVYVGESGFTSGTANNLSIAFNPSTNLPYIAFKDGSTLANGKLSVMEFDGSSWQYLGSDTGLNPVATIGRTSIAFNSIDNQPYVAYSTTSSLYYSSVITYQSGNWVSVGESGFALGIKGGVNYPSLGFSSNNDLYIAYIYASKAHVNMFDGTNWISVGESAGVTTDVVTTSSLAIDPASNQPYVAFQRSNASVGVMGYDGTSSWQYIGESYVVPTGTSVSLAFNKLTNNPYLEFQVSGAVNVMQYSSGSWQYVGESNFLSPATITSLVFNPSTKQPYVASVTNNRASVMFYPSSN